MKVGLVILSMIAGIIGTLAKTITSGIPFYLHLTKDMGLLVAGRILLHTKEFPLDISHLSFALFGHLSIGAIIAIGLGFFYLKSGTKFYIVKRIFYGVMVWLFLRNVLVTITVPGGGRPLDLITDVVALIGHAIYGLVAGCIIVKFNRFIPKSNLKE